MSTLSFLGKLRFPYSDYEHGFWGKQTSTLNFCEEDYVLSYYCAELINTTTNALFLWLGAKGIRSCISEYHNPVFMLAFIGYIIVALGSVSFHATLKYPMQLVDELSMIYTTCLMLYASFVYSKSRIFSVILGVGLFAAAAVITVYYHMTQNPVFHQVAYAFLTATVVFRSMWVMESQLRPALEARQGERSNQILKTMWIMVAVGLVTFIGGFFVWKLDNVFCSQIRRWRRAMGLPWAILLEGHGWWHLMTGTGAYYYIIWGIWLRHCLEGHEDEYTLYWPSIWTSMPELRRVQGLQVHTEKQTGQMQRRRVRRPKARSN